MFSQTLVFLAFASSAFASIFTISPVASSTFTAGQEATVQWQEGSSAPTLKDFGDATVAIYAGNAQQQTLLQLIKDTINVDTEKSFTFTPDPKIGPNSNEYFIRYESKALRDATDKSIPALAFSAKFTLAGMTGNFSDAVLAQIKGQSTAPIGGTPQTTGAAAPAKSTPATTTQQSTGSGVKAAASSTSSTKPTGSSAALPMQAGWVGVALSALAGIALF